MLIVFCVERPSEESASLGWGIELCRCSSCVWGLRSLLNTEDILTLPMFLLSDESLIQLSSASFTLWCRVLLSLSFIVIIMLQNFIIYYCMYTRVYTLLWGVWTVWPVSMSRNKPENQWWWYTLKFTDVWPSKIKLIHTACWILHFQSCGNI